MLSGKLTEHAYAKINLFLEVTGKRDDGYHLIDSIMQTVSLTDEITMELIPLPAGSGGVVEVCSGSKWLPTDRRNTAYLAAERFLAAAQINARAEIFIKKQIPSAAGLGGGSADAATVLRGLNRIAGYPFSTEDLLALGASIGADIPFCIHGGCCRCEGIGEQLTPLLPMPPCYPVIAIGPQRSQTQAAYRLLDENGYQGERTAEEFLLLLGSPTAKSGHGTPLPRHNHSGIGSVKQLSEKLYNAFEQVILPVNPTAAALRERLLTLGATGALMSGSGAAVFGLFETNSQAMQAVTTLRAEGARAWGTHMVGKLL